MAQRSVGNTLSHESITGISDKIPDLLSENRDNAPWTRDVRWCIIGSMQNHELERILTKIFKERMASTLQWNGDQFSVEIEDSSRV